MPVSNRTAQEVINRAEQARSSSSPVIDSLKPQASPQILDGTLVSNENGVPRYTVDPLKDNTSVEFAAGKERSPVSKGLKEYLDALEGPRKGDKELGQAYAQEAQKLTRGPEAVHRSKVGEEMRKRHPELFEAHERQVNDVIKKLLPNVHQNILILLDSGNMQTAIRVADRDPINYGRGRYSKSNERPFAFLQKLISDQKRLLSFEPLSENETAEDKRRRILLALSSIRTMIGFQDCLYNIASNLYVKQMAGDKTPIHLDESGSAQNEKSNEQREKNAQILAEALSDKYPGVRSPRELEIFCRAIDPVGWSELEVEEYNLLGTSPNVV